MTGSNLNTVNEIDARLAEINSELKNVQGTKTEVYTRIVGYHRAVSNWNKGKREEYDDRVTYQVDACNSKCTDEAQSVTPAFTHMDDSEQTGLFYTSYKLFTKDNCPNCPPVKNYMNGVGLPGEEINVTSEEGYDAAKEYEITQLPTVLFMNDKKEL